MHGRPRFSRSVAGPSRTRNANAPRPRIPDSERDRSRDYDVRELGTAPKKNVSLSIGGEAPFLFPDGANDSAF
jgi:hypothetical protein